MQMRIWRKAFVIVAGVCLAGLAATAQQQGSSQQQTGDPVADAARKAREERKNAPKPKKIYTDDEVSRSTPTAAPAPASTSGENDKASAAASPSEAAAVSGKQKATGEQKTEKAEKAEDPNSEAAWRKRFQAQRDKIAKAEKELNILGRELEKAQVEYYPDPQKALSQQNNRADIIEKNAQIDAKKKELDQLRQELDGLEDQLRKSGGDPGWAR